MATLHLHAHFPHEIDVPNAALGYLKGSCDLQSKAVYWYLAPRHILAPLSALITRMQTPISIFEPLVVVTAYMSRFFYGNNPPPLLKSLINPYVPVEDIKKVAESFKEFIDSTIERENMADVDFAGFTVKFYQWMLNRYVWCTLKKKNPNIALVMGGLDTAEEAAAFMNVFKEVDYAVWGRGEIPLQSLVQGEPLKDIPQLVYRGNNTLVYTGAHTGGDKTPFADHSDYFAQLKQFGLPFSPRIPVFSTRSCRWNKCKFCNENKGSAYTERPIQETLEEVQYQSEKYSVNRFIFLDADIGRRSDHEFKTLLKGLLEQVNNRKKQYDITGDVSPIRLTRENVALMAKIKMSVQIGFEAMTDTLLRKMNKMHRLIDNMQALKFAKEYKVDLYGLNIIRNIPGECEEDVRKSLEMLKYVRFFLHENMKVSELTLYSNTVYYKEIPQKERETVWVQNILCREIQIPKEYIWSFFGFRANRLMHHHLWDHFTQVLEQMKAADIQYTWLEFCDGTSVIEEQNPLHKHKQYLLTQKETALLKYCDTITDIEQLKSIFEDFKDLLKLLHKKKLLYCDERGRVLSVVSVNALERVDAGD